MCKPTVFSSVIFLRNYLTGEKSRRASVERSVDKEKRRTPHGIDGKLPH